MENLLTLTLVAHNDEENHHRHYAVTVGRDLLGDWTVGISYGRSGQRGRELRFASSDPAAMIALIRDRLCRRLSAPRRIGCPYRLAEFSAAPGFDAGEWLPNDMMDGFFLRAACSEQEGLNYRCLREGKRASYWQKLAATDVWGILLRSGGFR